MCAFSLTHAQTHTYLPTLAHTHTHTHTTTHTHTHTQMHMHIKSGRDLNWTTPFTPPPATTTSTTTINRERQAVKEFSGRERQAGAAHKEETV